MVDRRRSLHQELIASARAEFPAMLGTEVPYWSEIERMSVRRAPLPAGARHERGGAASTAQLWQQILQQVQPASAAAPVNAATDARAVPAQPLAELPQHP